MKTTSAATPRLAISWDGEIEAQAGRAILWLLFAVMIGAASYFTWPFEPIWGGPAIGIAACCACLVLAAAPNPDPASRKRMACLVGAAVMAGLAAAALGFTAGQWRAAAVQSPRIPAPLGPVGVEGWVAEGAMGASRPRLKILVRQIEGVSTPPRYVEISTTQAGAIQPWRAGRCFAILRPVDGHGSRRLRRRVQRLFRAGRRRRFFIRRLPPGPVRGAGRCAGQIAADDHCVAPRCNGDDCAGSRRRRLRRALRFTRPRGL